jgi:nitrogen regulatory protein P-II 1
VFSFIVTSRRWALDATIGRGSVESEGLDVVEHAETAYNYGERDGSSPVMARRSRRSSTSPADCQKGLMKLVTAVIKPFKLDDVKAAPATINVEGTSAVSGSPPGRPHRTYRGAGTRSTSCRRPGKAVVSTDAERVADAIVPAAYREDR